MGALKSDDFNRSNSVTSLGTSWTKSTGASFSHGILSNAAYCGGGADTHLTYRNDQTWPDDQYAVGTIGTACTVSDNGVGPAVRISASALTAYFAQPNTTETYLYKVVGASYTNLGTGSAAANGDVIYLEVVGTSLTVKKNGSTIITANDSSSPITSGHAGLWGYSSGDITAWEGGDINTGGSSWRAAFAVQTNQGIG